MPTEQLTTDSPDLALYLGFVLNRVRHQLLTANLYEVAAETGLSYSGLARLRAGGSMGVPTLELLAYYFSPKPEPKPIDLAKLTPKLKQRLPAIPDAPWNLGP